MTDTDIQRRRLWRTWGLLMSMTLVAMASGALHRGPLTLWALALVLVASLVKAQQILAIYLNLRIAPASWRGGLLVLVGAMGLALAAAGLLPRWIPPPTATDSMTPTRSTLTVVTTDRHSARHTERHFKQQAQEPR